MSEPTTESKDPRYVEGIAFRHIDPKTIASAVRATDPVGSGADRLARRLIRSMENRQAGFHDGQPVSLLLASGIHGEPEAVARAIAEALIGRDMDGAPLIHIRAEQYIGQGDLLTPLLGPATNGGSFPLLHEMQLFSPYVLNRIGRELRPLSEIIQNLEASIQMAIAQGQQAVQVGDRTTAEKTQEITLPGLVALRQQALEKREELYEEIAPNFAVIYVSGLEHLIEANGAQSAQAFRQLLQRMCVDGYAEIRGMAKTQLQDCLVIGSFQSVEAAKGDDETSQDTFRRIISMLSESATGREIIDDFGGERSIIVLEAPTEESQRGRLVQKLTNVQQKLADNFQVALTWSDEAIAYVLEKAADPDREGHFPSSRLDARFDETVLGLIASLVNVGGLAEGMILELAMVENIVGLQVTTANVPEGAEPISGDAIREIFSRETPLSVEATPEVLEIQKKMKELMKAVPESEDDTAGLYL